MTVFDVNNYGDLFPEKLIFSQGQSPRENVSLREINLHIYLKGSH